MSASLMAPPCGEQRTNNPCHTASRPCMDRYTPSSLADDSAGLRPLTDMFTGMMITALSKVITPMSSSPKKQTCKI